MHDILNDCVGPFTLKPPGVIIRPDDPAAAIRAELARLTAYVDMLISQAKEMEAETGKARAERDAALRLKNELLKAADALLGKMGGPNSPVQPVYEEEFLVLELLVDKLNGPDVESIEQRASDKRKCLSNGLMPGHGFMSCELEEGHDGMHRKTVNGHPFGW